MSPTSTRRRWTLALVGMALLVSTISLTLGASYRAAEAQYDIVQESSSDLYRLSALEWQAIATGEVEPELRTQLDLVTHSLNSRVLQLASEGVIDTDIVSDLGLLLNALETELVFLEEGDIPSAIEIDETVVDPLFEQMIEGLDKAATASRAHAHRAMLITSVGFVFAIAAVMALTAYTVRQANRANQTANLLATKDRFIASVSHELRTPLAAVVGFSSILRDDFGGLTDIERTEIAGTIASEAYDIAGIVEDLLVAARTELGNVHISRVPVDLAANSAQVVEVLPEEHQGRITIGLQPPGLRAWGDPVRTRQILRNLISNAVRYGGPEIRIEFTGNATWASLTVTDNGAGIENSLADKIFLPYQIAHDPGTVPASVGLGLTVTRQLIDLMDGTVSYDRVDGETIFKIEMPLVKDSESSNTKAAILAAAN